MSASKMLTPVTLTQVAALDDVKKLSAEQFQQLAEIARVDLDANAETLAVLGADELGRAEFSVLRAGAYFLKLKELTSTQGARKNFRATSPGSSEEGFNDHRATSPGSSEEGFYAALETVGVKRNSANRAMQIAIYVAALPAEQAKRIAGLPKYKILPLLNADPEMVEALLEEGALDGKQPLSVRDLRKRLADEVSEKTRLKTELEKLKELRRRNLALQAVENLPAFTRETREEAIFHTQQIMAAVELLEDVAARNLLSELDHPEWMRWQPATARTLAHLLGAPVARAVALLQRLKYRFGEEIAGTLDADSMLEASEATAFKDAWERLSQRALEEQAARADDRANTAAGKRGAPRGPRKGK